MFSGLSIIIPDELEIHIPSGVLSNVYFIDREFLKSTYLDTTNIDDKCSSHSINYTLVIVMEGHLSIDEKYF